MEAHREGEVIVIHVLHMKVDRQDSVLPIL